MYKVIVVDDEHWVLKELRGFIDWAKMDLELVGEASNGEDACTLVEQHQPHIVITDMNMPGLNGLGLLEWLRSNGYATKVIVLSGYGDFNFTRPSFVLDAFDYLLKPLNETELTQTLIRAVEEIKQESGEKLDAITRHFMMNRALGLMRDNFLSNVIHGVIRDENEMLIEAEDLKCTFPLSGYQVAVIKFHYVDDKVQSAFHGDWKLFYYSALNIMEEILSDIQAMAFRNMKMTNELAIILACPSRMHMETNSRLIEVLEDALSKFLKVAVSTGIGERRQRLSDTAAAYADALRRLAARSPARHAGRSGEMASQPERSGLPEPVHAKWKSLLDKIRLLLEDSAIFAPDDLARLIDELFSQPELSVLRLQDLRQYLTEAAQHLEQFCLKRSTECEPLVFQFKQHLEEMELERVQASFRQALLSIMDECRHSSRIRSRTDLIDQVKLYVKESYATATLDEIAKRFFINKNYFCTLFKSETGSSFIDYLTAVRMEHAKVMLENGHLKTYEVALKVGYKDQRYFSQVFRKHMGSQPGAYRNRAK